MTTPKGRIIIIRSVDDDKNQPAESRLTVHQFPAKIQGLLSEQKNKCVEIIATTEDLPRYKESYHSLLEKENNIHVIDIGKNKNLNDLYSKIFTADAVVFAGNGILISEMLRDSIILDLLNKKYLNEENFTIIGINDGAMCMPDFIINEEGTAVRALGLVRNCIMDLKFRHGQRCKNFVREVISNRHALGIGLNSGMAVMIEKGCKVSCFGSSSVMVVDASNVKKNQLKAGASVYAKHLKGHIYTAGSAFNLFNVDAVRHDVINYSLNFINRNTIQ